MDLTKVLFNLDFFIDASAKKTPMGEGVHSSDPGEIYFQNDVHTKIIYLLHNLSPFQETDLLVDVLNCFDSNTILTVSFLMQQKGLKKKLDMLQEVQSSVHVSDNTATLESKSSLSLQQKKTGIPRSVSLLKQAQVSKLPVCSVCLRLCVMRIKW